MLDKFQYRILKSFYPRKPDDPADVCSGGPSRVALLLGTELFDSLVGKTVLDFGCGYGSDSVQIARKGARKVFGVDMREEVLAIAREKARAAGVEQVCTFAASPSEPADVIVSIDTFEHFEDPGAILALMGRFLKPRGKLLISFGPTWYHPQGGHLFSVFPWSHLVFSETALMCWRSDFKTDGATRFGEVAGGLNRMTISRFERLLKTSPFAVASLELVPIRKLRRIHNRLTREFTTSVVRCDLRHATEWAPQGNGIVASPQLNQSAKSARAS